MSFLSYFLGAKRRGTADAPSSQPPTDSPAASSLQASVPREISPLEVEQLLKSANPPLLIDVREKEELEDLGWIPGAIHMPMSTFDGCARELDPQRPVIVYCAAGIRSHSVGCHLLEAGIREVMNLTGGLCSWGGPISRGTP